MFLIPILFIVLIVWFFVFLFNTHSGKTVNHQSTPTKTPLEILNERYARGEISDEEYQRIKRNLQNR